MSRLQESPEQNMKAQGKRLRLQKGGHQKNEKLHRKGQKCGYERFMDFFDETMIRTVPDDVKKCNFGRFMEMVGNVGSAPACPAAL